MQGCGNNEKLFEVIDYEGTNSVLIEECDDLDTFEAQEEVSFDRDEELEGDWEGKTAVVIPMDSYV